MGWNVLITVDANTGKGSAQVHKPVPSFERPPRDLEAQLGSGFWVYAADEDDDDVFVDSFESLPANVKI